MKRIFVFLSLTLALLLYLNGCLSVEKKEYKVTLTGKTSGKAVIKYVNIQSQKEDDKDVSMKDFASLVTDYIDGNKPEDEFPGAKNIKKKLYEENGILIAEFEFEFDSLETVKLFKYNDDAPYMLLYKESFPSETHLDCNGEYGRNGFSISIWDKKQKEFIWKTTSSTDTTNMISLVKQYRNWKKDQ